MPVMDQVWSLRSNVAERFNSVWASLTLENAKALPGKFVAAVVAVISAVVNLAAKPFVWAWSKVPAGPQPSLFSRVSNFFFGPSKLQKKLEEDKMALETEKARLQAEKSALESEKARLESELESEKARLEAEKSVLESEKTDILDLLKPSTDNNDHIDVRQLIGGLTTEREALKEELETVKKALTPAAAEAKKKNPVQRVTAVVTDRFPSFRQKKNKMEG